MAFTTSRPRTALAPRDEAPPRRWIAAVVWSVCLVSCLVFWAAVGLGVWLIVT